ncbi:MAG TPA: PPOX class F420-dependent oxidoreductase [Gaiellaceae bacterium]|nr:PPOX class F420-dependent oxidoreductase [Gaiellaceae bacterium]
MASTSTTLSDAQRSFLENPYVGIVTTIRPDGSPHSTVVWVDVDEQGVSFNTESGRAKPRYLEQNPQLALLVIDPGDAYKWVSISGRAELTTEGAHEQIDRLAKKYIGKDEYPWHNPEQHRITVRIAPETVDSSGFDG